MPKISLEAIFLSLFSDFRFIDTFQYSIFLLLAKLLEHVKWVSTNLEEDPDSVREEFLNFLTGLTAFSREKQDKEEQGIIGHKSGRR